MSRFAVLAFVSGAVSLATVPSQASAAGAAATIGALAPSGSEQADSSGSFYAVVDTSSAYRVPAVGGVITSWTVNGVPGTSVRLFLASKSTASNGFASYQVVATTAWETVGSSGVVNVPASLAAPASSYLGLDETGMLGSNSETGAVYSGSGTSCRIFESSSTSDPPVPNGSVDPVTIGKTFAYGTSDSSSCTQGEDVDLQATVAKGPSANMFGFNDLLTLTSWQVATRSGHRTTYQRAPIGGSITVCRSAKILWLDAYFRSFLPPRTAVRDDWMANGRTLGSFRVPHVGQYGAYFGIQGYVPRGRWLLIIGTRVSGTLVPIAEQALRIENRPC